MATDQETRTEKVAALRRLAELEPEPYDMLPESRRLVRERYELPIDLIAEACGVPPTTIAEYEAERVEGSLEHGVADYVLRSTARKMYSGLARNLPKDSDA